jgi:hypothetical protein
VKRLEQCLNGAGEILYVTGLSVVARGDHLRADGGRCL